MALIGSEAVDLDGLNATYTAVSASDTFVNNGRIILHVKNAGGSADTVSIVTPKTFDGLAVADAGGSVPAGEERFFGPFSKGLFNDGDGEVTVTHSFTTSVTMAILQVN